MTRDTDISGHPNLKIYNKIQINIRNKIYNTERVFSLSGGYPRWPRQLCIVLMISRRRRSFCSVFFFKLHAQNMQLLYEHASEHIN